MQQTPDTLSDLQRAAHPTVPLWFKAIPLLDRVVARVKAAGTAASVTADELAQLRIELRNAGGDLVANGPDRFIVPLPDPTGAGKGGSIEVVVDETGDTIATPELGALAEFPKAEIIRLLQFTHAQCAQLETELSRSKAALSAKLETEVAEVAKALDSYHAPTLLLAAVRCERAALLDPARAGEWVARSERLRELARAASAIGC